MLTPSRYMHSLTLWIATVNPYSESESTDFNVAIIYM